MTELSAWSLPRLILSSPNAVEHNEADGFFSKQEWRDTGGNIVARGWNSEQRYYIHVPDVAIFAFGSTPGDVTATQISGLYAESALERAYYRIVLPLVQQVRGMEVLHASAVQIAKGVVILCGVSRSGKSTVAYALAQEGCRQWADDSAVWSPTNEGIEIVPLPFSTQLRNESALLFGPQHRQPSFGGSPGKIISALSSATAYPQPVAALCILEQTQAKIDRPAELERLIPSQAFTQVLSHAHCYSLEDLERGKKMMHNYLELVNRIPVWRLTYRRGLEYLPDVIDKLKSVSA